MRGDVEPEEESIPGRGSDVAQWYDEYHLRLLNFLRAGLKAEADAEDVSQEVYLRLLRIPENRVVEHPRAYLFRVAANVINDWRTGQKMLETRPTEELDRFAGPDDSADHYENARRLERIERALKALPAHYRATIVLKTTHGMTYEEIAAHLGVSERMVKRYIVKAYARLRDRLAVDAPRT
ncbi:MAG TPA: sigma-70 family RNA polymerase sigma factor [Woeseiaceae bacterium]|nr:sigma-70 family RNA polymerase sigma factor [Woeseiaceae bacterium]